MNTISKRTPPHALDPHENPYHPFASPGCYRAFQEGWDAQHDGAPRTALPYPLSRPDRALAWLDGWTSAQEHSQCRER